MQTNYLESQIRILEQRLSVTPEKIGDKYNPSYFALRNALIKKKKEWEKRKNIEWLGL